MSDRSKAAYAELKECLYAEILGSRRAFSWRRIIRNLVARPKTRFYFNLRLAHFFYTKGGRLNHFIAKHLQRKNLKNYATDIGLATKIGAGLYLMHHPGVVIADHIKIGKNCVIRQNTTIGIKGKDFKRVIIGDNVTIGANSCIIGDDIHVGDNVTIGAMSFVNCNIPQNSTFFTTKIKHLMPSSIN
jgi:serine acetyltransferase